MSIPLKTLIKKRTCASPGFTLLELIVVIAIVAIVMAVATPLTIRNMRDKGARQAAEQLSMDLQRAKLLAIQRGVNCTVLINTPAPNQYTISIANEVVDLGSYQGSVIFTNTPDTSDPVITFTPQGVCPNTASFYLTNQKFRYRVRVTIAGAISLHLDSGGQWT